MQWPQALPWVGMDAFMRTISFLLITTTLVFIGAWWSKKNVFFVGSIIAFSIALLSGTIWPLLITLWFAISSFLLGQLILTALHIKHTRKNWSIHLLVGAGVYGTAVGIIAHFPVNYPGVYSVFLFLPILLNRHVAIEKIKYFLTSSTINASEFHINVLDLATTVVALLYFVVALMPELGADALATHLFVPAHVALRHQWGFDVNTYVWAVIPMLGEWIFSVGYMLAGETAVRFINVGFIFILSWLLRDLVLWAGGSIIGARWAILIFLLSPLTYIEGSSLFIESVWASFIVAGTLMLLNACSSKNESNIDLPIAGILLGCALAAKAVTLTILPVLLLLLIWRFKSWHKTVNLTFFLLSLFLFLLTGLIPYLTAWQLTNNPFFPFFNHIFQSTYYISDKNFVDIRFNQGVRWDTLYQITFNSPKYIEGMNGASGFQWLLLFFPAVILFITTLQRRATALLIIGILSVLFVFHFTSYLRYIFPASVILMAVIGVALGMILSKQGNVKKLGFIAVLTTLGLNFLFFNAGIIGWSGDFALHSIIDASSRNRYLERREPIRNAVTLINNLNIEQSPVAVFAPEHAAGLSSDAFQPSWYNIAFRRDIAVTNTPIELVNTLLKRGIHFIILDSNWNELDVTKRDLIEQISSEVAKYGSVSVRNIKLHYRFQSELLSNPDFTSRDGWLLSPGAKYNPDANTILVSVNSPANQQVSVSPGQTYLNTIIARCAKEPAWGRIQINWLDIKGQFIDTNINVFECSPIFTNHAMIVTAPKDAIKAEVYVTGHTASHLEFKKDSLRQ